MINILILFLLSGLANAELCMKWSPPIRAGQLDYSILTETSGLAFSRQFRDRTYHHNDSGSGPFFYITNSHGQGTQQISIKDMNPQDVEDMAIGPCSHGQCLFFGDIGDNRARRESIQIWLLPELESYVENVEALKKITLVYPDRKHDAEALAVDPLSGDIFILTKEADYFSERRAYPAKLFKLSRQKIELSVETVPETLEYVGDIDLPWINFDLGLFGQIVTSMDISSDGKRLILLTYENAIEIRMASLKYPMNSRLWVDGLDIRRIEIPRLLSQQEAIAYSPDGNSFYFDSEFNPGAGDTESVIYRLDCLGR